MVLFYHEKSIVVCSYKKRLIEAILMSTRNIPIFYFTYLFFYFFFIFIFFLFFLSFFLFRFKALSRIFYLYQADRSSKVGENRKTREKPPDHP